MRDDYWLKLAVTHLAEDLRREKYGFPIRLSASSPISPKSDNGIVVIEGARGSLLSET